MTLSDLITAIVRTYDGSDHITVQIDPPTHRADGMWYAHFMVRGSDVSLAAGRGLGLEEALFSLASLVRAEIREPSIDAIAAGVGCPCGQDREDHSNICDYCSGSGLGPPCDVCQGTGHT